MRSYRPSKGKPVALDDLASSRERIHDDQADNAPTSLEIFRQQGIAPGFERGGDNQGVVEAEAVSAGEGESLRVDRHIDRANGIERNAHIGDGFSDNVPLEAELPAKDGCELIQGVSEIPCLGRLGGFCSVRWEGWHCSSSGRTAATSPFGPAP